MASPDVRDITPDYGSIWRCPCGWEGPFARFRGHRRGYKNRPGCYGPGEKIWDPAWEESKDATVSTPTPDMDITEVVEAPDTAPPEVAEDEQEDQEGNIPFEYRGLEDVPLGAGWDPEEWARHFNAQRQQGEPPPQNGDGVLPPGGIIPPIMAFPPGPLGDFEVEPSIGPPHLTTVKQTITVPPIFLIIYDYMINAGWRQGDGTLSAMVTDFVLDHFHN